MDSRVPFVYMMICVYIADLSVDVFYRVVFKHSVAG